MEEVTAPEALILEDEAFQIVSASLVAKEPLALDDDGWSPARQVPLQLSCLAGLDYFGDLSLFHFGHALLGNLMLVCRNAQYK